MNRTSNHSTLLQRGVAAWMLFVFVAYLVYLPIHAISGEHCIPGVDHNGSNGVPSHCETNGVAPESGHSHHEHSDGSTHHNHHSAEDHEVESTGKIGSLKWIDAASAETILAICFSEQFLETPCQDSSDLLESFAPGKWLISRGPPLA